MGTIKNHHPVKLISGFIFRNEACYEKAKALLRKTYGEIDFESQDLPFNYTDYYREEFGKELLRRFVSFKKLVPADSLAKIKNFTNKIEGRFSKEMRRSVNIDPGFLDLSKLILASTKDYSHRIYLGKGIYAELTLFFKNKTYCPLEWTYPDYRTIEYIAIFNRIREIYARQVKDK